MALDVQALIWPIIQIIWINVVLSGDNAVVIALACRSLPEKQRRLGVALGTAAAIVLRIALTAIIVEILLLPYVRIVGGILLFWIAIRLAREDHQEKSLPPSTSLWGTIGIIVVADAVMSLDNALAIAAAANGSLLLVAFGLVLSVPIIIFGATLFAGVIARWPAFVWAGAALLGYVGGELIASDPLFAASQFARVPHWETLCGGAGLVFVVVVAAAMTARAKKRAAH
jgi:YjbE family integral membrane protein